MLQYKLSYQNQKIYKNELSIKKNNDFNINFIIFLKIAFLLSLYQIFSTFYCNSKSTREIAQINLNYFKNNIRKLYTFNPIFKQNENECEEGKDNKCLSCDKGTNLCKTCNFGYKLIDGKCVINHSIKIIYISKKVNETFDLINLNPTEINEMIINFIE